MAVFPRLLLQFYELMGVGGWIDVDRGNGRFRYRRIPRWDRGQARAMSIDRGREATQGYLGTVTFNGHLTASLFVNCQEHAGN